MLIVSTIIRHLRRVEYHPRMVESGKHPASAKAESVAPECSEKPVYATLYEVTRFEAGLQDSVFVNPS